ncbi:MAG: serine hydrolase [Bacillota bacterium]
MKKLLCALFIFVLVSTVYLNAQSKTEKIDKLVKSYYESEKFMGTVLAAEKGKVIYRKGIGYANIEWKTPNSPEGVFRIASITKTFAAVLTMQLVQEGKLKLESKISEFLPYYRKDIGENVTMHHLLTHSSGIPNYLQLPGFTTDLIRNPMVSVEDFIKKYCSNDLQFKPGEKFTYNNSGYAILGAIIEKVTGQRFEEVLKVKILDPAGMKNTGFDRSSLLLENRVTGYVRAMDGSFRPAPYWDISQAYAAGQMYSTVDDMLKYHEALMGEKLLKDEFKKIMFTKYYPAFGHHYGYGWMIRDMELKKGEEPLLINSHEGGLPGFNLYFARIPEKDQVAIILNNTSDAPLKDMSMDIFSILNGLEYKYARKSLTRQMYKVLNKSGIESALKYFNENKSKKGKFDLSENELNALGYELMNTNRKAEALEVFKIMAGEFPESSNAYDSLAEGYMNLGDNENAIKYYQKSLELNPQNVNAETMIKKIKQL